MSLVILYGEQGSGKSKLVGPLKRLYGLEHVVEEWDGKQPSVTRLLELPSGCLAVTNCECALSQVETAGVIWLHVEEAKTLVAKILSAAS